MGLRDRIEGVSGSPGTSHVRGSYAHIGKCQLPEISEGMTGPSPAFNRCFYWSESCSAGRTRTYNQWINSHAQTVRPVPLGAVQYGPVYQF
jgi:hypothetical protein